jgi:hypothetical protein
MRETTKFHVSRGRVNKKHSYRRIVEGRVTCRLRVLTAQQRQSKYEDKNDAFCQSSNDCSVSLSSWKKHSKCISYSSQQSSKSLIASLAEINISLPLSCLTCTLSLGVVFLRDLSDLLVREESIICRWNDICTRPKVTLDLNCVVYYCSREFFSLWLTYVHLQIIYS